MDVIPSALRLPFTFDARALALEADALPPTAWVAHFNQDVYVGEWSAAPLRSAWGLSGYAIPNLAGRAPFLDTPLLASCPVAREVLATLECETTSARFLRLGPGAWIGEHVDEKLGAEFGEARLHVIVRTNPDVDFAVDGRTLPMRDGELWYVDVSHPHRVRNGGETSRIHLVVDAHLNPWLADVLARGSAR